MRLFLIASMDAKKGIGRNGILPWHYKKELKFFQKMTTNTTYGNRIAMFMGKNTYRSLPESFKPKNRNLYVISSMLGPTNGKTDLKTFSTVEECVQYSIHNVDVLWCIGGSQLYHYCLNTDNKMRFDALWITQIEKVHTCDTFFPIIPPLYKRTLSRTFECDDTFLTFEKYTPKYGIEHNILKSIFKDHSMDYL
jgi:dihydrofolate reductase